MSERSGSAAAGAPYAVLVVGSGAREHALIWALAKSPSVSRLWAIPGNPGMTELAETVDIPPSDVAAIAAWADARGIGLVVVGPEAPLALGLADLLQQRGIAVFGPTRAAAELEWSKGFAKEFMRRHDIPTAPFGIFDDVAPALDYARAAGAPLVVKADGLAAGKGVIVCQTVAEAEEAIRAILVARAFGEAGERVVIEDFLAGEELSVIALVDGERFATLPLARDYKRLGDGDRGPNTGGMGSFAPVTGLDPGLLATVRERVIAPTVAGLRAEGRPFRGALYAGIMVTADGPQVLEFNCRFGDPETQVILPLLDGDLAALLRACAAGRLDADEIPAGAGAAVCVVLAAAGYPEQPRRGEVITGIPAAQEAGALVFQAGAALRDGHLVTQGGRVLSVVGTGDDLAAAARRAYAGAEAIAFAGKQFRRDIAAPLAVAQA